MSAGPPMFLLSVTVSAILASTSVSQSKPAPPKTTAAAAKLPPFDARSPHQVITLLESTGAKVNVTGNSDGQFILEAKANDGNFGVQFIDCNAGAEACHAVALFTAFEKSAVTLAQINDFNRAQFACRGLLAADGRPSVMYSTLLNFRMTRDEFKLHLGVWHACIKGFEAFNRDPEAFLSKPH